MSIIFEQSNNNHSYLSFIIYIYKNKNKMWKWLSCCHKSPKNEGNTNDGKCITEIDIKQFYKEHYKSAPTNKVPNSLDK